MSFSEKQSLLPINSEACQRLDCAQIRHREQRNRKFRIITFAMVAFMLLLHVTHRPVFSWHHRHKNNEDVSVSQIPSEQIMTQGYCDIFPTIPFQGVSHFESPQDFDKLSIKVDGKRKYKQLSIAGGTSIVLIDPDVSKVTTTFDIKLNSDLLQDKLWIEEIKDDSSKLYSLVVRVDDDFMGDPCIILDTVVRLPVKDALDALSIGLPVSDITLDDGLVFNDLSLSVAKGELILGEDQTVGSARFSIASGDIHGTFKQLNGDLSASSAKGDINININEINDGNKNLKLSSASGSLSLGLPSTFDSSFKLTTFMGTRTIQASHPDDIHLQHGSFGKSVGHYGDADHLRGQVDLSSAKGDLTLSYTQ
ncbi:hypothetical protein K501DRAFT_333529 [Backusella circina FSU 941]|nr:hypothetical protein K501DRAFT_333529 [Backusella circina FSU 941]